MNKICLLLITLIFNISVIAEEISSKERDLVQKISQTIELLGSGNDIAWKDFNLSDTPIVVTFSNNHIYAFGFKNDHPTWEALNIEYQTVLFTDVDQWGVNQVTMQDKFLIDGEEAFVFSIDENEKKGFDEQSILVLVHELFHRYQFDHFKKVDINGDYTEKLNTENLTLIALEERILVDFLRVPDEHKLEVLKNYIAVHSVRNLQLSKFSIEWENFQQRMEGLADYTSIQTFDTLSVIPSFDGSMHLQRILSGYIYSDDAQELAVKWRHYGVGAALGKALDFLKVNNWKDQIELQGESQGSILEKTVVLSEDEIIKRLEFVKKQYKYAEIKEEMDEKVAGFSAMIEQLMDDYDELDGLVAMIEKPRRLGINGGGSSYGIYHLDNGLTVSVNDKSVSSSTDNTWKIELKDIPFLFQNGSGARILKLDSDLSFIVDGKSYTLNDLKERSSQMNFERLSWDCKTSSFESMDIPGKLIVDDNGISVIFNKVD